MEGNGNVLTASLPKPNLEALLGFRVNEEQGNNPHLQRKVGPQVTGLAEGAGKFLTPISWVSGVLEIIKSSQGHVGPKKEDF